LLDKTGTLTYGKPCVSWIEPSDGYRPDQLLQIAAAAERNSEHPLALAIVAAAQEKHLPIGEPSHFSYTPGKGVHATVDGRAVIVGNIALLQEANISLPAISATAGARVLVASEGRFIGSVHIEDQVRDGASEAIRELQQMGLQVELLTGDTEASARAVAESIGIPQVSSGLLPDQKSARVDELIHQGRTVAMIGDGINDAPALSRAHVGVAMGSGTEIAHASANLLLIGNDLRKFAETVKTARWCRRVIFQNFYGTLAVDALGIVLAALGMINPLFAAFIHVSSELTFILNSTRLLPRFSRQPHLK
jgi:P-type E1-E2 ATPase